MITTIAVQVGQAVDGWAMLLPRHGYSYASPPGRSQRKVRTQPRESKGYPNSTISHVQGTVISKSSTATTHVTTPGSSTTFWELT